MRKKILFPAALLLLVFSFVLSLCVGSAQISIREAVSALQNGSLTPDSRILFYVRLPRALAAVLSGAALAVSGVLLQNVLNNALAAPNIIGVNAGAGFAVSQLFFDVREYEALVEDLRAKGLKVPVVPGILPIQSFDSLRRVLSLCGANIPGKLYLSLEEAHRKGGAEAVRDAGLDFAVRQICQLLECGAPGIHLYTLNKGDLCLQIAEEVGM